MEQEVEMHDEGIYQSSDNHIISLANMSMTGSLVMAAQSESNSPISKGSS